MLVAERNQLYPVHPQSRKSIQILDEWTCPNR